MRHQYPGAGTAPTCHRLSFPTCHHAVAAAQRRSAAGARHLGTAPGNVRGGCDAGARFHSVRRQARARAVLEGGSLHASVAEGSRYRVGRG